MEETEDTRIYKVVVNHEEQYSIWFADREPPLAGVASSGPKAECLAYIKEIWTDMRPLSLRKKMDEAEKTNNKSSETWFRNRAFADRSSTDPRHSRRVSERAGERCHSSSVTKLSTASYAVS